MRRSSTLLILVLVGALGATLLVFGVVLRQRFSSGEVYERCSTYRTDGLGSKALFEALDHVRGVQCERSLQPLDKLIGRKGSALVMLSVDKNSFDNGIAINGDAAQQWVAAGGRLIITLTNQLDSFQENFSESKREAEKQRLDRELEPFRKKAERDRKKKEAEEAKKTEAAQPKGGKASPAVPEDDAKKTGAPKNGRTAADEPNGGDEEDKPAKKDVKKSRRGKPDTKGGEDKDDKEDQEAHRLLKAHRSLSEVLDLSLAKKGSTVRSRDRHAVWDASIPIPPEERPAWHSSYTVTVEGTAQEKARWQKLTGPDDDPALLERRIGQGTVIVATDSIFTTNEALFREPSPAFLMWLFRDVDTIIFDETHLGTSEEPGIMTLARRYRLHGLFIGGIVLFALFAWKSGISVVPSDENAAITQNAVAGQSATAGLVSLLRRAVPHPLLLQRCLEAWERGGSARARPRPEVLAEAKAIIERENAQPRRHRQLAKAYREICAVLHPKR